MNTSVEWPDGGLRRWVGFAINEGGTVRWGLGWIIKLSVELIVSTIIGVGFIWVVFKIPGTEQLPTVYGVESKEAFRLFVIGGLFYQILFCEYDLTESEMAES